MELRPYRGDIVAGVTALALAFAYDALSIDYENSGAAMATDTSGAYTSILAAAMACCGVLCLGRAGLRAWLAKGRVAVRQEHESWPLMRILLALVVLVGYVVSMPYLGFVAGSWIAGGLLLFILGERNGKRLIGIPGGWVIAIYLLFAKVLMIPLPLPFFMQ
ncbi:MAG TPA: tripartite tricarboxylate transporter TctB family protein [Candidatus Avidesulfovibrio excrementigallinarum]|nr:tripartite tricarboxylate transporter TctB family protein [Candidatus Avidesulfovibrio excrementigallinarum]